MGAIPYNSQIRDNNRQFTKLNLTAVSPSFNDIQHALMCPDILFSLCLCCLSEVPSRAKKKTKTFSKLQCVSVANKTLSLFNLKKMADTLKMNKI